jgi:hypothetical protein
MANGRQPLSEMLERSGEGEEGPFGRPRDANAPQLDGTGEIRLESPDRATGYFTTRADKRLGVNARTAGTYWRADPEDLNILDGRDDRQRAALIAERLRVWKSITNA